MKATLVKNAADFETFLLEKIGEVDTNISRVPQARAISMLASKVIYCAKAQAIHLNRTPFFTVLGTAVLTPPATKKAAAKKRRRPAAPII